MEKVSRKSIESNVEDALRKALPDLQLVSPKKIKKMISSMSKKMTTEIKRELKNRAKEEKKAQKKAAKVISKQPKTIKIK